MGEGAEGRQEWEGKLVRLGRPKELGFYLLIFNLF